MNTSPIKDSEVSLLCSLQPRAAELVLLQVTKVIISLQFVFLPIFLLTRENKANSSRTTWYSRVYVSYFKSERYLL